MLYEIPLVIAANTTAENPKIERVELEAGRIEGLEVEFPEGCVGLAGVRVFHESNQLSPRNAGQWHVTDDRVISAPLKYMFVVEPLSLILHGYNLDDSYQHAPRVRIHITPLKEILTIAAAGKIEITVPVAPIGTLI